MELLRRMNRAPANPLAAHSPWVLLRCMISQRDVNEYHPVVPPGAGPPDRHGCRGSRCSVLLHSEHRARA